MKKARRPLAAALAVLLLSGGAFLLTRGALAGEFLKTGADKRLFQKQIDLFVDVFALVRTDYVDEVKIEKLFAGALSGMLRSLDPYSQYLDPEAYKELKADTEGSFGGIGVEVGVKAGVLRVIAPLDDSPAAREGIKPGDVVVKIDDSPTRDMPLAEAVRRLRGLPGSAVRLNLMREGSDKMIDVTLKREKIAVKSVKEARLLEEGIAYLRFAAFQENSAADFEGAIAALKGQGMQALILDIRNNSGGLLTAAIDVTERFVPEGKIVVSTRGRGKKSQDYVSRDKEPLRVHPLIVLVNKGSASGSEILAGAIQDHKLGVIVGHKTFGKASIQTLVPLPDGAAIRMTTSKYYTPKGRLIHEQGIQPDVVFEEADANGKDPGLEKALELARSLLAGQRS